MKKVKAPAHDLSPIPMPHEALRCNERTTVGRSNGRLKEVLGGRMVMVQGPDKVMMHLMFGIITLFADLLLLNITGC